MIRRTFLWIPFMSKRKYLKLLQLCKLYIGMENFTQLVMYTESFSSNICPNFSNRFLQRSTLPSAKNRFSSKMVDFISFFRSGVPLWLVLFVYARYPHQTLKVLTHKLFCSEYVCRPPKDLQNMSRKKKFLKKTLKNYFENRSGISPILTSSLLLLFIEFLLWLPPSQRFSAPLPPSLPTYSACLSDSINSEHRRSLENPPWAWVRGYEKPRGAQRSTEKAGATEGIQWAGEGGSSLRSARARNDF